MLNIPKKMQSRNREDWRTRPRSTFTKKRPKLGPYVRLLLPTKKDPSSRVLVSGRSKAGKTTLVVEIIKKYFSRSVDRIFVVCSTFLTQKTFKPIRDLPDEGDIYTEHPSDEVFIEILSKIKEDLQKDKKKKFLLFLDDLNSDYSVHRNRKGVFASLSVEAPHFRLSIIGIFQQSKAVTPSFRNNVDNIIYYPPADKPTLTVFEEEFTPYVFDLQKKKMFRQIVSKYWENGSFIFIHRPRAVMPSAFINFDTQVQL